MSPRLRIGRALALCGVIAFVAVYAQEKRATSASPQDGGDIIPFPQVSDPYPVFNGIAVDPINNLVAMSDVNRKSLMSYSRSAISTGGGISGPRRQLF